VAASLSSLVAAVQLPNSVVNAAVLGQIVGIVDTLAGSLLTGVTANAPPIDITSPAIQMRVQVDAPGAGSRLFSAPLTANGSASAFAPMPALGWLERLALKKKRVITWRGRAEPITAL
jgi:hypothetical protein